MRRLAAVLVLVLAGCAGDASPAVEAGCRNPKAAHTEALYVQDAFACDNGGRLLTFKDNTARDAFVEVAEYFGSTFRVGDRWAYELP
jgi:hypothetical protein